MHEISEHLFLFTQGNSSHIEYEDRKKLTEILIIIILNASLEFHSHRTRVREKRIVKGERGKKKSSRKW